MREKIFEKDLGRTLSLQFGYVLHKIKGGGGSYSFTAAHHQRAIEMFWPQFWEALMSSVFIYSQ